MNAQDLKNSILQRAIEGKLVPQRKEEGTAKELLAEIRAEKARLIKEKKIKKSKPLPEITDEEKPFDIPDSWEWVRLDDICKSISDGDHQAPPKSENGVPFLVISDVRSGKLNFKNTRHVPVEYFKTLSPERIPLKGDILFTVTGSYGIPVLINVDMEFCFQRHIALLKPMIDYTFLSYILESPFIKTQCDAVATGTAQKTVGLKSLKSLLLPLPPLYEQGRIITKIEELQPDIDAYDKAQTKLQAIEQRFPDDMKKSLLQYAIEGKLVPQRKEEGTAKDLLAEIRAEKARLVKEKKIKKSKPLPEITDDEKPFDIPDSWEWVRLDEVIDVRDGTHDTPPYYPTGIPLITSKNLSNGKLEFTNVKYISKQDADNINKRSRVDIGDILFAMIGSIGNPVIVNDNREFCIKNIALFKQISPKLMNMKYIYFILVFAQRKLKGIASGGVQSFISLRVFRRYIIPIPPLAEQHRIVAKLEELLPLCQQLAGHP
jgi:type I restriction enzyme S subunit